MNERSHRSSRVNAVGGLLVLTAAFAVAGVYHAATWDRPHREAMVAMLVAVYLLSLLIVALPPSLVFATRRRRVGVAAFWNLVCVALVAVSAALDGGLRSPIAAMMFVAVVFASVSYASVALVAAVGFAGLASTVAVGALVGGASWPYVTMFTSALAIVAGTCVWQAHMGRRRRRQLAEASRTDPLTGCLNRRGFVEQYERAVGEAERTGTPFALVEFDIDGFKEVNDVYGHEAGDRLLVQLVRRVRGVLRSADEIARLGGDEFVVLAAGADREGAQALVERIERALSPQTGSIGVAVYPHDGRTLDELYRAADAGVYKTKRSRRSEGKGTRTPGEAN